MMKKIFISIFGIAIIIFIVIILINTSNNTSRPTNNTIKITKEEENINWDNFDTFELNITDSTTITNEGIYHITGKISDGMLTINTDGYVKLVLDNVTITNNNGPAINIENSKKTYIELKNENTLTDNGNNELNGAIYSKDDLIIEGDGKLVIKSNQDGIVSKDDLIINNGFITINSKDDGIIGKDSIEINGGSIKITIEGDGIKTTNNQEEKGYILINDGNIDILSTGTDSQKSHKGIKAETIIEINGGTFNINTTDDGIHSNGNITINNGKYTIISKDDAIHSDTLIEINNGEFKISAAEGIEATYVKINDGNIDISASDDGINAGNKSSEYKTLVEINGGNIIVTMEQGDTDGVDSNGDIIINGGTINIIGNSPFDYDGTGKINGGTVMCNNEQVTTIPNQMIGGPGMGKITNQRMDNKQQPNNSNMYRKERNIQ